MKPKFEQPESTLAVITGHDQDGKPLTGYMLENHKFVWDIGLEFREAEAKRLRELAGKEQLAEDIKNATGGK